MPTITPRLRNGDRLTRDEFARRWDAMPNLKVAELIDGVVYLPEIGSHVSHGCPAAHLIGWSGFYVFGTRGAEGGCHSSLMLDDQNVLQPDALLMIEPSCGGQARLDEEGFLISVPEWIGEVTATSASYDLHGKLEVYRRFGVKEYVVWRVLDRAIDWFILRGQEYARLLLSADGTFRSEVFPGLWLDAQALIACDTAAAIQAVQRGLASPEHQQFVEHLAQQAARP